MFSFVNLIQLKTELKSDRGRLLAALRDAATQLGARHVLVEPTLPGSRNGGDILMHLRFAEQSEWDSVAPDFTRLMRDRVIARVDGATYAGNPVATQSASRATVYRALLLRVASGIDDATVARFEADLQLLPRYVPTITAWQLSRVKQATGSSVWTHVFEQQFTDVDGLMGSYLMHPIHWGYVDRWFDPEYPGAIVQNPVCHSFCRSDTTVLC